MTQDASTWRELVAAGIVTGDPPPASMRSPWYVRALLGIGGWIAAGFVIGFVSSVLTVLLREPSVGIPAGLALIGASAAALRFGRSNAFISQLALAMSFAGQGIVFAGTMEAIEGGARQAMTMTAFEAVLALVLPHPVHRVFCAAAAGVALAVALTLVGAQALAGGLLAAAVATMWLTELRWARWGSVIRPMAYGVTAALVIVQATWFGQQALSGLLLSLPPQWAPRWLGAIVTAGVLLGAVAWLLQREGRGLAARGSLGALAATTAICAVTLEAPGIAAALMIVLAAHAAGNRVLMAIGIVALLGYTSAYYYLLETTLLVKSVVLIATGVVLLLARWTLPRWFMPETVHAA